MCKIDSRTFALSWIPSFCGQKSWRYVLLIQTTVFAHHSFGRSTPFYGQISWPIFWLHREVLLYLNPLTLILHCKYPITVWFLRPTTYFYFILNNCINILYLWFSNIDLPWLCSFETSEICGMIQSTTDNFDWTRQAGQTDTVSWICPQPSWKVRNNVDNNTPFPGCLNVNQFFYKTLNGLIFFQYLVPLSIVNFNVVTIDKQIYFRQTRAHQGL